MTVKITVPSLLAGKNGEWHHVNPDHVVRVRQNLDTGKFYLQLTGLPEYEIPAAEATRLQSGTGPLT